jgi:hypothetical protein
MAYYTALINKWATIPSSITITSAKQSFVNSIAISGSVPTSFFVTGDQILNCINWPEFAALTATQQSNLLALCSVPGQLLGGSTNTAFIVDGMILASFPVAGPTVAALTALAKATVQPWWQVSVANGGGGLSSPVNNNDLLAAGLT